MHKKLHLIAIFVGFVVLATAAPAAAADQPPDPDARVAPAGCEPPDLIKHIATGTRTIFQRQNPFHLELPNLAKDAADVSEVLLQVFDADAAPEGRWKGYGLMELKTERAGVSQLRTLSASIDFVAPAEGIYCLRTVARDRAGNTEQKSGDLRDVQWVVVLDRTPPKVELQVSGTGGKPVESGSQLAVAWKVQDGFLADPKTKSAVVEVSRDGGRIWHQVAETGMTGREGRFDWKVDGPDTDALLVRVSVSDASGNRTTAALDKPLVVKSPEPAPFVPVKPVDPVEPVVQGDPVVPVKPVGVKPPADPVRYPGMALRAYQTGVIYMNRGELEEAAKFFEEAIRLDVKLAPAYVDLTATYLGLYDRDRVLGAGHLDKANRAAADGLKALPEEVALYYNHAQAQYRLGQLDAAAGSLNSGLAVQPRHIESLYLLALIRATQKRTDDAVVLWRQVAALGGMSAREIEKRLAREAVRCLAEAEKVDPKRSSAAKPPAGAKSAVQ